MKKLLGWLKKLLTVVRIRERVEVRCSTD